MEAKAIRDTERYYVLRPEVVEGWFFLWRVTGDQKYREWCWTVVQAIDKQVKECIGKYRALLGSVVLMLATLELQMWIRVRSPTTMCNKALCWPRP